MVPMSNEVLVDNQAINKFARAMRAYVTRDSAWQRRLRVGQAFWRYRRGLGMGGVSTKSGSTIAIGSMLDDSSTKNGANFFNDRITQVVNTVCNNKGKALINEGRLRSNLLSSQPLAFNCFAEFVDRPQELLPVVRMITGGEMVTVRSVRFEYSPGRGEARYTGDRSAYDVYIEGDHAAGGKAFLGVEVKYHEDMLGKPARITDRHCELASELFGRKISADDPCFLAPQEQLTRDRLLVHAHAEADGFTKGWFVFLYPESNPACGDAVDDWTWDEGFVGLTLEKLVDVLSHHFPEEQWPRQLYERYVKAPVEVDFHLEQMERLESIEGWAKRIQEELSDVGGHVPVYFRPGSRGVAMVSTDPDRPQVGKSGITNLRAVSDGFDELYQKHCMQKPSRPTPEKRLQSYLIAHALKHDRRMPCLEHPGEEIYFITDEISLNTYDGKIVCDMVAAVRRDGGWCPMLIELKSERAMKRLIEQLDGFSCLIERHRNAFCRLANTVLRMPIKWSGSTQKVLVWPAVDGPVDPRASELAQRGIRCVGYRDDGADIGLVLPAWQG
jgi:PD-(D/E)XK nuclease superfamily